MKEQLEGFCHDLNELCRKYKVNFEGAKFEMNDETYEVDVNGAYDIRNDMAQLELHKVNQSYHHVMDIKGTRPTTIEVELNDMDDPPEEYGNNTDQSYEKQLQSLLEAKQLEIKFLDDSQDKETICRKLLFCIGSQDL